MIRNILLTFLFFLITSANLSSALDYSGRVTFGTFVSLEQHETEPLTGTHNDFATSSTRLYYQAKEREYLWVTDLRDKHDFFDKLDKEKQELTDRNTFQLRKLYLLKSTSGKGTYYQIGRFSVDSMGSAFVDGIHAGYALSNSLRLGAATGLNPKALNNSYVETNKNASIAGGYVNYSKKYTSWYRKLTSDAAVVQNSYLGEVDRLYLYFNNLYQWANQSYLWTFAYFDTVPSSKLQNGSVAYSQQINRNFRSLLAIRKIDVIEYRRQQDLRETIESSPYSETRARGEYTFSKYKRITLEVTSGLREIDNLTKTAFRVGYRTPRAFSRYTDMSSNLIIKDQFNKKSQLVNFNFGYFRKKWELDASFDYGIEQQTDEVTTLHPIYLDLTGGYHINRSFLVAGSLQYTADEKVSIMSTFFKLSYRFGNQGVAPLRDGAAPRGRL